MQDNISSIGDELETPQPCIKLSTQYALFAWTHVLAAMTTFNEYMR